LEKKYAWGKPSKQEGPDEEENGVSSLRVEIGTASLSKEPKKRRKAGHRQQAA